MITDRERWLMQEAFKAASDLDQFAPPHTLYMWLGDSSDLPGATIEDQIAHEANVRFPSARTPTASLDVADTGRVALTNETFDNYRWSMHSTVYWKNGEFRVSEVDFENRTVTIEVRVPCNQVEVIPKQRSNT